MQVARAWLSRLRLPNVAYSCVQNQPQTAKQSTVRQQECPPSGTQAQSSACARHLAMACQRHSRVAQSATAVVRGRASEGRAQDETVAPADIPAPSAFAT